MVKRLLQCVREYKKDAFLTPLFVSVEVVLDVIIPLLMARIIDDGIANGSMDGIARNGILLVCCTILALVFGVLSGRAAATAAAGFSKNLRHDMFHRIQDFSFANIDKFSSSSLITRLTTDVSNVQMAFQMSIRIAVRSPMMLIFSLLMARRMSKQLSLVFLGVLPILAIGLFFIMTNAHPIVRAVFKKYDRLNNVVQENLSGIRVVKSYVREDFETEKFKEISQDIYANFSKAEKILALNSPLMQFSMYMASLLLSWFGAKLILSNVMTTGELMSLFSYTMQMLMSLMMLSMIIVMLSISRASAERIVQVLEEENSLTNCDSPIYKIPNGDISFQNVCFSYNGNREKLCLTDINVDIKAGETIGIIGGTGSGKSSMVQLIPRLYDTTDGVVRVGGIDVRRYDVQSLREEVAMVLQKNELFKGTIKENLRWGNPEATDEEMVHACQLAQADEFIRGFAKGYDTMIEQGGTNVSGGQKQRLCIARALLKKPKILILDDSTSAVDVKTDAKIRKAFAEEIGDTTKIIIAQRVSSVEQADRIIVMEEGRVHGFGTHEELLKDNKIYQEVYESQKKGGIALDAS